MNDKNRQRHIAYEVLVILGQLALLTYITRLWPILFWSFLGSSSPLCDCCFFRPRR